MNLCTGPFGSAICWFTDAGLIFVLKVSLMMRTVSFTYVSLFDNKSAICRPTIVPIATMNPIEIKSNPNKMMMVELLLFHPRRTMRSTPGSRASATNNETNRRMKRSLNRLNEYRTTNVAIYPIQKRAIARGTQRGIRRDSVEGSDPGCSVTFKAYLPVK